VKLKSLVIIFSLWVALTRPVHACEFVDYFHQVTAIRGHVVGRSLGPLQFRWLRQSFRVTNATLTLYEYRSPAKIADLKRIVVVKTDAGGDFDFGKVEIGHYYLHVGAKDSGSMEDWFEVEVTDKVRPTEAILIDISPIHPDCTGGHEFIEKKK
jgi:hypothetical protein